MAGVSLEQQSTIDGGTSRMDDMGSAWASKSMVDRFSYDRTTDKSIGLGFKPWLGYGSKVAGRNKELSDPKKDAFNKTVVQVMNNFGTLSKFKFSMSRKNVRNNFVYLHEKKR